MAKRKVKWAVSKDEPDDLQDFQSNDEIVGEHGWPKPGLVRLRIKQITHVENRAGDPMLKVLAIHDDESKDRKKFNGFALFENQNVTDVSEQFLKRFINSIGASWADFRLRTVEDTDEDPVRVIKIGDVDLSDKAKKPVYAWASIRKRNSEEYGESMEVSRWVVRVDKDADEEAAEDEEIAEAEEEEAEAEVEEVEAEEEDEDVTELREELDGLKAMDVRKRLRDDHGWKPADYKGFTKEQLVDAVIGETFGEEEADEEEAEEEEEEEGSDRRAELDAMKDAALKKLLRDEYGYTASDYKGHEHGDLVDLILEEEDEGEPPF